MFVQLARISLFTSLAALSLAACGDNGGNADADPFATLEECFTDHHGSEGLPVGEAIVICCLDHPIGSSGAGVVCGADAATCTTYVTASLQAADATSTEISAACADYVTQKNM
jgi:hypothetical protein